MANINSVAAKQYIPVLDGLRGISIILVLISHLLIYDGRNAAWLRFPLAAGSTGVTIFFVISGYLITSLLIKEERASGKIDLRQFYVRRILRIFPAYYLYLGSLGVLVLIGVINLPAHDFAASILYIRNLVGQGHETAHIWSLSLEEQFYLAWPTLMILCSSRKRMPLAIALIVVVALWRTLLVLTSNVDPGALYIRTDMRMDSILVGCLFALLFTKKFQPLLSVMRSTYVFLTCATLLVVWIMVAASIPRSACIDTTVIALLAGFAMTSLIQSPSRLITGFFTYSPLLFVGRLSYSLYLWQQLFFGPPSSGLGALRKFPFNLICAFLAAALSYHLIEQPFLALKKRFSRTQPNVVLIPATAVLTGVEG